MHNCDTIRKEMFLTKMQQSNVMYTFIHHEGSIKQRRKTHIYDTSLKTTCFGLHSCRWKFTYIFNHVYAVRRESYPIRWNNAD